MYSKLYEGDLLDNTYKIIEEIGSGGIGIIYKAYHLRLDKYIIVKQIKINNIYNHNLNKEANILKNLRHTYLPTVYDFVEKDNIVYTVMDYIEGKSLDRELEIRNKFPQKTVLRWILQMCDALIYLHNKEIPIIHCDIKPSNIMLTKDNNICLIDFNVSYMICGDNEFLGYTEFFSPPELRILKDRNISRFNCYNNFDKSNNFSNSKNINISNIDNYNNNINNNFTIKNNKSHTNENCKLNNVCFDIQDYNDNNKYFETETLTISKEDNETKLLEDIDFKNYRNENITNKDMTKINHLGDNESDYINCLTDRYGIDSEKDYNINSYDLDNAMCLLTCGKNNCQTSNIIKEDNVDAKWDIYSLGMTMFVLITGKLVKNMDDYLKRKILIENKINKNLIEVIMKSTEFNPSNRYDSVEEIKSKLENIIK